MANSTSRFPELVDPDRTQAIADEGWRFAPGALTSICSPRAGRHTAKGDPGVGPGLRAYRLPWPDGTTVCARSISRRSSSSRPAHWADLGAEPTANRRTVPIDLRADWPAALAGRRPRYRRTDRVAGRGPLIYLPGEAQDRLFDTITALSAPGSEIATEYVPGLKDIDFERVREQAAQLREHGLDIDMPSLVYAGERSHVIDYLRGKAWNVAGTSRADLFVSNGSRSPRQRRSAGRDHSTLIRGRRLEAERTPRHRHAGTGQRPLGLFDDPDYRLGDQRAQCIRQQRPPRAAKRFWLQESQHRRTR